MIALHLRAALLDTFKFHANDCSKMSEPKNKIVLRQGAKTFALTFDISRRLVLSNGAYEVSHTPRALDDDNGKIAGDGFYNVLKRLRAASN
jgi:hypothetical protein